MTDKVHRFGIIRSNEYPWDITESILQDALKEFAGKHGCNPDTLHNFDTKEGNGYMTASASFHEKDNDR